jgi:hypothetical protein
MGLLGGAAGSVVFANRAAMDANLSYGADTMAWVISDPVAANNGIYQKNSASGFGAWVRRGDLPYSFVKASDAGAGSANSIIATTSTPLPTVDGAALIALNIFEANTASPVTVAFNGGIALTIKTNSGNDIAAGGLTAGMIVAGYVSGPTFRLLSDQASAAIQTAAEAAQMAAETAQTAAEAAQATVEGVLADLATDVSRATYAVGGAVQSVTIGVSDPGFAIIAIDGVLQDDSTYLISGTTVTPVGGNWPGDGVTPNMEVITFAAVSFPLTQVIRKRYINVSDYVPGNDAQAPQAGVPPARAPGNGREIVFTNPYGGTRYYRFMTRANGRIFMPQKGRIICEPAVTLDFSGWGDPAANVGDRYLYASGTVGTEHPLTANAAVDTNTVTVSAANSINYAAGDDIFVRSAAFFTDQEALLGTQGEWASVIAVNTGTGVLTLGAKLRATYNTVDAAYITKATPVSLQIENMNLLGAGRFSTNHNGDRGIQIQIGKNCRVIGGNIRNCDFNGVVLVNVLNGVVDGTRVEFQGKGATTGLQYGVAFVNMNENVYGRNCDINGGSEGLCLSSSGQPQGVTRDVGFTNCRVRGSTRSGVCTHDNHENLSVIGCVFEDCELGIEQRVKGGIFTGNSFRRMGAYSGNLSTALHFGAGGGKVIFANNYIEDALRGVNFDPSIGRESGIQPGEIHILNNVMRAVTQWGVRIANTPGDTSANGLVRVAGNSIWGPTHGVEVEGKFYVEVMNNSFRFGPGGGRTVFLHATGNGAGTNGAVDPVITGNMRDGSYLEPLLQHVSGTAHVANNGVIGSSRGMELIASVVWDVPSLGDTFGGNFASTTVTVTGAAMGDVVSVGHSAFNTGVVFQGRVSAANTVTVHALNITTSAIDLVSGTLTVKVTKA